MKTILKKCRSVVGFFKRSLSEVENRILIYKQKRYPPFFPNGILPEKKNFKIELIGSELFQSRPAGDVCGNKDCFYET